MTEWEDRLKCMQEEAEVFAEPLRTLLPVQGRNNNLMIRYELLRHVAYAMVADDDAQIALEMLTQVANEVQAWRHSQAGEDTASSPADFRDRWTKAFSFEKQGWFAYTKNRHQVTPYPDLLDDSEDLEDDGKGHTGISEGLRNERLVEPAPRRALQIIEGGGRAKHD